MFDALLERIWEAGKDIPVNEETDCTEIDFIYHGVLLFPKGTEKIDTWYWFDERHSIGVCALTSRKEFKQGEK